MTEEEMKELKGLAASMGLYDDKNPCKRAVILGKAIKALAQKPTDDATLRDIFCMGCEYKEQEHCPNAISRSDMLDAIGHGTTYTSEELQKIIKALPPVAPQPKIGRWIAYEVRLPDRTILNYQCSVCGRKLIGYNTETLSEVPFCHCGAKMV